MVAAKCGARVTLSDREGSPDLLKNLKKTCEMNRVPVAAEGEEAGPGAARIMGITWGVFSPELLALAPQDIVLASDCFYDVKGKQVCVGGGMERWENGNWGMLLLCGRVYCSAMTWHFTRHEAMCVIANKFSRGSCKTCLPGVFC